MKKKKKQIKKSVAVPEVSGNDLLGIKARAFGRLEVASVSPIDVFLWILNPEASIVCKSSASLPVHCPADR